MGEMEYGLWQSADTVASNQRSGPLAIWPVRGCSKDVYRPDDPRGMEDAGALKREAFRPPMEIALHTGHHQAGRSGWALNMVQVFAMMAHASALLARLRGLAASKAPWASSSSAAISTTSIVP